MNCILYETKSKVERKFISILYNDVGSKLKRGGGARHIRNFYKNDNVEIVGWRCAKYTRNISVFAHCQPTISTTSMVVMLLIHWLLFSFPSRLYLRRYQRSMETWLTGPVKGGWGSLSCQYTLWNLRFLGLIRKREEKLAVFGFWRDTAHPQRLEVVWGPCKVFIDIFLGHTLTNKNMKVRVKHILL